MYSSIRKDLLQSGQDIRALIADLNCSQFISPWPRDALFLLIGKVSLDPLPHPAAYGLVDIGNIVLVGTGHFLIPLQCLQNERSEGDFLPALVNTGGIMQISLLEIAIGIIRARRR